MAVYMICRNDLVYSSPKNSLQHQAQTPRTSFLSLIFFFDGGWTEFAVQSGLVMIHHNDQAESSLTWIDHGIVIYQK